MKIKSDFVTNSSSACYILAFRKYNLEKFMEYVEELDSDPMARNEGVRVWETHTNMTKLKEFTNGGPIDWVQRATGPKFINLDEKQYHTIANEIRKGKIVLEVAVDYEMCSKFSKSKWYKKYLVSWREY